MTRILTMLAGLLINRILAGGDQQRSPLIQQSMLMLRKIIRLFFVGFGFLLVGVISTGLLLREITSQIQINDQVVFSGSLIFSAVVAALSFAGVAMALQRKNWLDPENFPMPTSTESPAPQQPDLVAAITALVAQYLEEKSSRPVPSASSPSSYPSVAPSHDGRYPNDSIN